MHNLLPLSAPSVDKSVVFVWSSNMQRGRAANLVIHTKEDEAFVCQLDSKVLSNIKSKIWSRARIHLKLSLSNANANANLMRSDRGESYQTLSPRFGQPIKECKHVIVNT